MKTTIASVTARMFYKTMPSERNPDLMRDVRRQSWTYKGKAIEFEQPAWYCAVDATHDQVLDQGDKRTDADSRLRP